MSKSQLILSAMEGRSAVGQPNRSQAWFCILRAGIASRGGLQNGNLELPWHAGGPFAEGIVAFVRLRRDSAP
jgi:hypothetical protein